MRVHQERILVLQKEEVARMAHYRSKKRYWALLVNVLFPWGICGCASFDVLPTFGLSTQASPIAEPRDRVEPRSRVELPPSNPKTAVTAVQDFLERTQAYDLSKTQSTPEPLNAADVVFKTTPPIRNETVAAPRPIDRSPIPARNAFRAPNKQVVVSRAPSPITSPALPVIESISIQAAKQPDKLEAAEEKLNTANQPLDMGIATTPLLADELIEQLEYRASAAADFVAECCLGLTHLALARPNDARRLSPTLPAEQSTVLSAFLELAVAIRSSVLDPWLGEHDPLERMDQLRTLLMNQTDPSVRSVALCSKVVTYGVYDEMATERFIAGRSVPTIVYSEIANLQSDLSEDARFVTRLRTRIELLTVDGKSVWNHEEPEIVDRCRQRRHDFFIAQRVTFPPTLPAGDYVLKVYAEDKLSSRAGETTYPMSIHSALTVASGK
jgi:hypothetical protein